MEEQNKLEQIKEILETRFRKPKDLDWLIKFIIKYADKLDKGSEYSKKYYGDNKEQLDNYHSKYRRDKPEYRDKARERSGKYYND